MAPIAEATATTVAPPAEGQQEGRGLAGVISRIDRVLGQAESGVILVSYATLIVIVGVETLRRALIGAQEVWGPEIALYAFVWLSWFSMAKHGRYGTHLSFSELRQRLPKNGQRALELIDCALWVAIGVIIIVTSWGVVENQIKMGQTVFGTPIPLAVASLAVPVGWAFSMVRILQRAAMVLFAWDRLKAERGGFLNL
ncbi:TRAP transporter small permease [Hydrogenophaga borbori]|jgi:C4-dicarboxylate transporter, DctQ subunit|uniref:TRAP transporter small permease n=1 Tax=Hydrogenophaga borbori TaxID=2294117 RepID=UPI00301BEF84